MATSGYAKDQLILKWLLEGIIRVDPATGQVWNRRYRYPVGFKTRAGYLRSSVRYKGQRYFYQVHRAIWVSQKGAVPEGLELDHINGVKTDNRLTNLEVVTGKVNKQRYHAAKARTKP